MNFEKHADGWIIEPNIIRDARGSLTKTYDESEFAAKGLNTNWTEQLQTVTSGCGNVRGMHWQESPHEQIKLVRCVVGWVHDVIVDIRPESPNFGKPFYTELTSETMRSLYIPAGYAHGFQCVSESCIMHYCLSSPYNASASRRFHHADPEVGIKWPVLVMKTSDLDASAPPLSRL
jgi:dTDP-4-dehydrorhamnose 3,5-epimerase